MITIATLLLLAATLMWGASFVLIKVGLEEIPPVTLATLRFSFASLIFLAAISRYKLRESIGCLKEDFLILSGIGFTGIFLPNVLQNIGMQYTTASISSILMATGPIFVAVLAAIFLGESLGARKIIGIGIALFGAAMISTQGDIAAVRELSSHTFGNILLLLSAVSYGPSTILAKIGVRDRDPILVVSWSTILGSLLLIAFTPFYEPVDVVLRLSPHAWGIVIALAILPTAVAFLFWFEALKRMEASKVSFFIFFIPVFATIFAYFFLQEAVTGFVIANAALVLFGVYLAESEKEKEDSASK
ncbi:MAG: DMT family transporter [Candidatus Hydrothermarchaeales archaeon]